MSRGFDDATAQKRPFYGVVFLRHRAFIRAFLWLKLETERAEVIEICRGYEDIVNLYKKIKKSKKILTSMGDETIL